MVQSAVPFGRSDLALLEEFWRVDEIDLSTMLCRVYKYKYFVVLSGGLLYRILVDFFRSQDANDHPGIWIPWILSITGVIYLLL